MRLPDQRPGSRRASARRASVRCALAPALLLAFGALPAISAAQDTLVLRDGTTRTGQLSACVGDRCALDGEIVMREEIVWIGLAVDGSVPTPSGSSEDEAFLTDGSTRRGAFVGLSLGAVNLGAEAIDRAAVRWIRFASAGLEGDVGLAPIESDVVLRRNGGALDGELLGCNDDSCTMGGGDFIPRDAVAWIGLGVGEQALPPLPPADATQDAVQLADGPLQTAPLLGIDDSTVVTGRGSYSRSNVDWIYLAPPPPDPESAAASSRPERPPLPPETEVEPPPPPQPPPQRDTPSTDMGAPPAAGERGALWVGTIQGIYGFADTFSSYRHTYQEQVRLREYVMPGVEWNGQQVQRAVLLYSEGSTHGEIYESAENPNSDSPTHCSGQASTTMRNEVAGGISAKLRDVDLTPLLGYDLPAGSSLYRVGLYPPYDAEYEPDCASRSGSWKNSAAFMTLHIGRDPHPGQVGAFPHDAEIRYLEGARMVGSYQRTNHEWYASASWSICRQGSDCPPAPPPPEPTAAPPSTDPCPPPTIQQGLLDVELQRQRLMMNDLTRRFDEYSRLSSLAAQHKNDYEQAERDCGLTQLALVLGGFLISNPGVGGWSGTVVPGNVSPQAANALGQFYNFLGFVDKVATGDSSWLLPDVSFKDFAKIPDGRGGFLDAESVYDGVRAALGFLDGYVSEQSPESLIEGLRNCGGFTIDAVMDGAIEYLRLLQRIQPLMTEVQTILNNLEDADERIFNAWVNYRQACLEHQACIGGDPAICDQLPAGVGAAPPNN